MNTKDVDIVAEIVAVHPQPLAGCNLNYSHM